MRPVSRNIVGGVLLGCAAALLGSCGGGGSGTPAQPPSPGSLILSTSKIVFKAAGPFARAPATQMVTGTVGGLTTSGTLYIKVVANNPNGFFTVSNVLIAGDSGQVSVIPEAATSLEAGSFKGSITVTACLNDPTCQTGQLSGSPQTIPVEYDIASGVDGDTVTPRVVAANTTGTVVLRGAGFTGATSVSFGSAAATSITVVSDSEIDASYPALAAGTYPVSVDSGSISDSASLVAVSPPAFTQTFIQYPLGVGGPVPMEIEYDAQRTALYVLMPGTGASNPTLLRYAFDGSAWGSPTQISMANLQQVHLSSDGTHLLALASADVDHVSMVELDPVTLAQTGVNTVSSPNPGDTACGFALANDGNAIVDFQFGTGFVGLVFGTFSGEFTPISDGGGCNPVASGNGAVVALGGTSVHDFVTSSETVIDSGAETSVNATSDLAGDELLNGSVVQNQAGQILGYLTTSYSVINSAGTRAYGYTGDPTSCAAALSTFDLTATPTPVQYDPQSPQFPVLGTPTALPSGCFTDGQYVLAITPDDATVFIARPDGVIVQPISP
jgi:hypothetical protein